MRTDNVASGTVWNSVLGLLKISFALLSCAGSQPNGAA
jgi:hypothetical protein